MRSLTSRYGARARGTGLRYRTDADVLLTRRITRAAVERTEAPLALEDPPGATLGTKDARVGLGLGGPVPAVGVAGASDVLAEAAVSVDEVLGADRAGLARGRVGLGFGLASRHAHRDGEAAGGVGGAAEEGRPVAAGAQLHGAAAVVAGLVLDLRDVDGVFLGVGNVDGEVAVGIAAAGHEEPRLAHSQLEGVAALRALVSGIIRQAEVLEELAHLGEGKARLDRDHLLLGALAVLRELAVELPQGLAPVELALLHFVELFLHPRRVLGLEEVVEALPDEVHDEAAQGRGHEAPVLLAGVLAGFDLAQDVGVGGRASDAVLFEELHERGFVEPRRGLGLVDPDARLAQLRRVARREHGQPHLGVVVRICRRLFLGRCLGVGHLSVDRQPTRILEDRTGSTERGDVRLALSSGLDVHGRDVGNARGSSGTPQNDSRRGGRA